MTSWSRRSFGLYGAGVATLLLVGTLFVNNRRSEALTAGPTTELGGIKFVTIKKGSYRMGSPTTEPGHDDREKQRPVTINKDFLLSSYEITVAEYNALINPTTKAGPNDATLPITRVTWDDAEKFCKALSAKLKRTARLPYEEEWEYACRAGSNGPFANWKGNLDDDLVKYKAGNKVQFQQKALKFMNCVSSSFKAVGSYPANDFGLYDMHGNVWEWCKDYSATRESDSPSILHRPIRGGSWVSREWAECRSGNRAWELKEKKKDSIGFRVLVEIP